MAGQSYYNPMNGQPYMAGAMAYPAQPYMPASYQTPISMTPQPTPAQTMISVDGEMAARAWQMPAGVAPGTVIPLWDVDMVHVYFKSVDNYGRLNPMRKARIVFEDEPQNLPEGQSGMSGNEQYVSKADFDAFRNEMRQMMGGKNQNGSYKQQGRDQRGGSDNA